MINRIFLSKASLIVTVAAVMALAGCSTINNSATDVVPIATETGELIARVEFGLEVPQPVLLIRYIDEENLPAVDQFGEGWNEMLAVLREMVRYSIVLIEIVEEPDEQGSKELLAKNIEQLYAGLRSQPSVAAALSEVDIASIASQIRGAEKFIDAARASQQAIDPAVEVVEALTAQNGRLLDAGALELFSAIGAYHADVIGFQDTIARRRNETISALKLLDKAALDGDQDAWNALRNLDEYTKATLKGLNSPTPAAVDKAQAMLLKSLADLMMIRQSLDPDFELYQAEVLELRDIVQSIDASLAIARLTVHTWDRGHQQFVDGKKTGFAYYTSILMNFAVYKAGKAVF